MSLEQANVLYRHGEDNDAAWRVLALIGSEDHGATNNTFFSVHIPTPDEYSDEEYDRLEDHLGNGYVNGDEARLLLDYLLSLGLKPGDSVIVDHSW